MHYKAVIFDLDGTLLDTLDDLHTACNYALAKNGIKERTKDEVRQFVGNGVKKLMERATDYKLSEAEFAKVFEDFKEYYGIHCNDKTKAYDGIYELLDSLKQKNMKMAIVSNKYLDAVVELADRYFGDYIKVAIGEHEGVNKKPAPDTVIMAAQKLEVDLKDCIYVGDSDVDFATAKNANIPCISCLWGFRDEEFLRSLGAVTFVKTPMDVIQILEKN